MYDEDDTPPFVFYERFADDWDGFSRRQREIIIEFLEDLRKRYDDAEFQRTWKCEKRDKYWGARLPEIEFRVFWTVVYQKGQVIFQEAKEIRVVAVEPIPGRK